MASARLITRRSAVRIRPPQPHSERETRSKDWVSSSPGDAQITFRSHSAVCWGAKDCSRAGLERHLGHEMVAQITQPPPEATPSRHQFGADPGPGGLAKRGEKVALAPKGGSTFEGEPVERRAVLRRPAARLAGIGKRPALRPYRLRIP